MKILSTYVLLMALPVGATQIVQSTGQVLFEGKPVSEGYVIRQAGELRTGAGSHATVLLTHADGKSELRLTPETRCLLEPEGSTQPAVLLGGTLRARLQDKVNKSKFSLRTKTAVMAVRGTDFFATFNALLGDSEIVVFEGTVKFTNAADAKDTKEIPMGHWGGVGGRYGKKIGPLIQLSPEALQYFEKTTAF